MDPTEAARICGQAAKTLAEALGRETDPVPARPWQSALSSVSGRMDPTQAAKTLAEALGRETDAGARSCSGIGAVGRWRAGWTRPRPHVFAAVSCVCQCKSSSQWPQRAGRGMILHSCQDSSGIWIRQERKP